MTVAEFRTKLETGSQADRARFLGKLLREARDTDVWLFVSPAEVWKRWSELQKHLGRRRGFWQFLFDHWRKQGLIAE